MTTPQHPSQRLAATGRRDTFAADAARGHRAPDSRRRPPSPIQRLERLIGDLELAALDNTPLSTHAAVQVIDSATIAVVVYEEANIPLLEQAIRRCDGSVEETTRTRDVITVTI